MMKRLRQQSRGMTLIEIALAVAILAMMATLTWSSIANSHDAYESVKEIDDKYHNVRVALNRMAKEISMAYLSDPTRNLGKEQMWVTHFKGEPSSPAKLDFNSFAHQILRRDAKESDQCEIGYYAEGDPEIRGQTNLMRREDPRPDAEWDKGGRAYILAEDIKEFRIRYFDAKDDDWTDEWDTEDPEFAGRLPTIVELTLVVEGVDGKDMKFSTKTRINLTRALSRF